MGHFVARFYISNDSLPCTLEMQRQQISKSMLEELDIVDKVYSAKTYNACDILKCISVLKERINSS